MKTCTVCRVENEESSSMCVNCYSTLENNYVYEEAEISPEEQMWRDKAEAIKVFTTLNPVSIDVRTELGLVFGNSSKQAFWGLSTQANRLSRAYEAALQNLKYDAALMGADAVIGVTFALNNSTGSGATLITGSSEAVMLLGTAVKTS
jgi:uncharacterized protein YbjQ (UPF0145 family)